LYTPSLLNRAKQEILYAVEFINALPFIATRRDVRVVGTPGSTQCTPVRPRGEWSAEKGELPWAMGTGAE
jgi:hypothetical protein